MQAGRTLVGEPQFQLAFAAGLAGLVLAVLLTPVWRRWFPGNPLPAAGLLVAAATLIGLHRSPIQPQVAAGLLLLAGAVPAARLVRHRWLVAVAAAPGAVVVALASTRSPSAVPWVPVATAIVVLGALVADFDTRHRRSGLGPVLLAVAAAGVYVTVPDTEAAAALLGAAVAVAFTAWPRCLTSLEASSYVAVGALVAVAADGGRSLATSVLGAVACMGLLAAEPLAGPVATRLGRAAVRTYPPGRSIVPVVAAHALVVAGAGRVAGQTAKVGLALAVVAADAILAVILATGLLRRPDPLTSPVDPPADATAP